MRVEFYKKYIKVFNYNFYLRTTLSYFKPLIKVIVYFSKCEKNNLKGLFFYFWASAKKTALLQSSSGEVNHFHLCTNRKGKIIKVLLVRCAVNWIVIGGGMNRKRPFCCTNFTLRLKLAVKVWSFCVWTCKLAGLKSIALRRKQTMSTSRPTSHQHCLPPYVTDKFREVRSNLCII